MDNSIEIKNAGHVARRVGISQGEYVVLDGTSEAGFHGYIREWSDLTQEMRNALERSGLVKVVNGKGKIL